ncbi:MAG: nucleotidyltransferase family protein [Acidobacteriota bacterium]|nr:nucleotidyltransferase family protein [Acidobacteriota bacterium]
MLDLYDEFHKLVRLLEEHEIAYALCGGLAMAVHGRPRATIDIDMLILAESLQRVVPLVAKLGYDVRGSDLSFAKGAIEIRRVSKIDSESGDLLSLDLLLVTPEVRSVWESRIKLSWEGGKLSVVSQSGLISLKLLRASGQDLDDIKALQEGVADAES